MLRRLYVKGLVLATGASALIVAGGAPTGGRRVMHWFGF
jgi:hypothetical protein